MEHRRTIGVCRIVVVVLCVIIIALIVALAVVVKSMKQEIEEAKPISCAANSESINLEPPEILPPFHDLTPHEIRAVKDYLYSQQDLNLVKPSEIMCNRSYIFTMEINVPNKQQTLNFLDMGKAQPEREAKVIIFRGDKHEPYVEEYIVGPLPNPIRKKNHVTYPFRYRPLTAPEMVGATMFLKHWVDQKVGFILEESYGGKINDCGDKCIDIALITPVSPATTKEPRARKMWFWFGPKVEFPTVHPYDFRVQVDLTSNRYEEYSITSVTYGGDSFPSLDKLAENYKFGSVTKTKIPFPEKNKDLYSSMNRRGTLFPEKPLSPPIEYEPSGKRYSINGRHIKYMLWDFDVRMSTISGPQLFDIRFNNKRIVYELSVQEIAVMYSAHNPAVRFADYVDSVALIGSRSRSLVPGADCPQHSTFLGVDHVFEYSDEPVNYGRSFCVFEHNTGRPLRRHLSSGLDQERFYEGMADIVLTVRTIATVMNYDYIFDFIFHQNGAVEVKAVSTGYIVTSYRLPIEDHYGFAIRDHVTGNLHHHMFNFKVDMDINGRQNRFETLNIVPTEVDNSKWSTEPNAKYSQTKFERRQVKTEMDAAMKYNFSAPSYLTFYNNDYKSSSGVPRAYRLWNKGMSKQLFPENKGQEASVSWARYQVAVTKYKEDETRSSSMYAIWDAEDPVVNFQSFIDDNEIITDEDQVAWVTMGVHHIPHMEDLPTTPTVGLELDFFLLPYNYFDEDPALGSSDAVRIEPSGNSVKYNRYGREENPQCLPRTYVDMSRNAGELFDTL